MCVGSQLVPGVGAHAGAAKAELRREEDSWAGGGGTRGGPNPAPPHARAVEESCGSPRQPPERETDPVALRPAAQAGRG